MKQYLISFEVQDGENKYYQHYTIFADNIHQAERSALKNERDDNVASNGLRIFRMTSVIQIRMKDYEVLKKYGII